MESNRTKLIELLSNHSDTYVSGESLSKQLGISRSAIWKHMNELKKVGYQIEAVRNKGYRITGVPSELSASSLQWGLSTNWLGKNLIHHKSIDSTQFSGHDLAREDAPHGTVIIADHQTKGRGRLKRQWHSEDKHGLWFTVILRPTSLEPKDANQLTLVAAVALVETFRHLGLDVKIKWPNDVFSRGFKLTGILTEMQAEQDQIEYILLGIGMNINQEREHFPEELRDKVTSLKIETGKANDLAHVFHEVAQRLEEKYDTFIKEGFQPIKREWEQHAYRLNEWLTIKTKDSFQAKFVGIQHDGALLIEDEYGKQTALYSAEIYW
ncbi:MULTISPECIES: biotin--[acetyl-CoA-carboxylase] ligase [Allobacillus]|uniref:Bifunctional ligase/repressor BirA n=1 Tax=Allobacillus halotolerans TaxID=570278 RepID=A0ABS6GLG2_9BACI|nr:MULTISPECIES: biotin--[acetyl-CoA-carboxylase] ligase [Allobacillus]MBU6079494.1 biotin--[acetyl-CoA-carboxylase] ligase [Allobacillus halotolerans]TSJ69051.1 biotin--[acetyl-CoA-carboxylase] ligase [Allobacillus sp. SKP2-8]